MARKTRNLADVIRHELANDPDLAAGVERERFNLNIASEIYRIRKDANLTQTELAERIGTHQPVIARLEDADYDSHSLSTLLKLAEATNKRLVVEFVDKDGCVPAAGQIPSEIAEASATWERQGEEWEPEIDSPDVPLAK